MEIFVAIDVETANSHPESICSIGAVKVKDGIIVDTFYELVKPEPEYYFRYFTESIHGIGMNDTENARTFDLVWHDIHSWLEGLPLVAHNKAFDEKCIKMAHKVYQMDYPAYIFYCTLIAARKQLPRQLCPSFSLPYLCDFMGILFDTHPNALAYAEACAKIALTLL